MKKTIITIAAALLLVSCQEWLEVPSSYVLSEETVQEHPELVETQFLSYYPLVRQEMHTIGLMRNTFGYHPYDTWTEDATDSNPWMSSNKQMFSAGYVYGQMFQMSPYYRQDSGAYHPYWPYSLINQLNKSIAKFKGISDPDVQSMLGEAYYLRALLYFGLVERYGGVPLFDEPFDDAGAINVRTTEEQSWDFVKADLDRAIELLPVESKYSTENKDRAIRNTALTLKSRAMLYAGTLAKYGPEPFNNGFQGVPASKAESYLKEAAEAASMVVESGMYSLTTGDFAALFDGTDKNNSEIIFRFSTEAKQAGLWIWWDRYMLPVRYQESSGAFMVPTLEAVETFETTDGVVRPLDYSRTYPNQYSIFDGRDKRLYATVLLPGSTFLGLTMDVYNRTVVHKSTGTETWQWEDWNGWNDRTTVPGHDKYYRSGLDGGFFQMEGKGTTNTGFYLKKFMYGASRLDKYDEGLGNQDAVVFRYAEVILNLAEAAVELSSYGDSSYMTDAQDLFNQLRSIHGGLPAKALNVETVRHERRVETMFECTRYFDLKRWRTASSLHQSVHTQLWPVLHIDETTTPESVWYTIEKAPAYDFNGTQVNWFEERDYYCPLPSDTTPGLVQNTGWEGVTTSSIFAHMNE